MRTAIGALHLGVFLFASALTSRVHAGPDAQKLKHAAESFESGARAFKDGKFEEAAAHFEAADSEVPGPKALRLAIRARDEAGQDARAATLASLALERYPDDPETRKVAEEELAKVGSSLHKLQVSCASPCLLALASRALASSRSASLASCMAVRSCKANRALRARPLSAGVAAGAGTTESTGEKCAVAISADASNITAAC